MLFRSFRGEYRGFSLGKLVGYAWVLDYDRARVARLSSATFGARFKGAYPLRDDLKLLYTAEYAYQTDIDNNPGNFGLNYFLVEPGVTYAGVTGKIGFEFLDGNGINALQTPLATGHAFQGWADQFLSTPANGIEDLYFHASTAIKGVKLIAVYHDFNSVRGSTHYGSEIDAKVYKKFFDHLGLELKYANYFADKFKVDIQKIWLSAIVTY